MRATGAKIGRAEGDVVNKVADHARPERLGLDPGSRIDQRCGKTLIMSYCLSPVTVGA